MENLKLAPTAAAVLYLADKIPTASPPVRRYLERLDLSAGEAILPVFLRIWEGVRDIIKNRKYIVSLLVDEFLTAHPDGQVVALAAGVDSLSLEATSRHPRARAYDLDMANMPMKQSLLEQTGNADRIRCLTVDLSDTAQVRAQLATTDWNAAAPTIVVVEGVSYYIDKDLLWRAIAIFKSPAAPAAVPKQNRLVFEYLRPYDEIAESHRRYARGIYTTVARLFHLPPVTQYSPDEIIRERLPGIAAAADAAKHITMRDIEKRRTGANRHFRHPSDSILEIIQTQF